MREMSKRTDLPAKGCETPADRSRMAGMRQILLDTETTGLDVLQGHRVIEIGCVEMIDRRMSGNHFHQYIHPERDIDEAAVEVHGITLTMLQDKPRFSELADEFLSYIKGAELIIHNAPFDVGFLNQEFARAGFGEDVIGTNCDVLDTLVIAKHKHPGQKNSLDALCKRYSVDNSQRTLHGALLDAEILADVYLRMTGGQLSLLGESEDLSMIGRMPPASSNPGMRMGHDSHSGLHPYLPDVPASEQPDPTPLVYANRAELAEHERWLQLLDREVSTGAIWHRVHSDDSLAE